MKASYQLIFLFGITMGLLFSSCKPQEQLMDNVNNDIETIAEASDAITVSFTLETIANEGKLAYLGIGGDIDGVVNPDLYVQPEDVVKITLVNGDGMPHDLFLPDFDAKTAYVKKIGDQTEIVFAVGDVPSGIFVYYCTVPGHRQAGQEGKFIVTDSVE